MLIVRHADQPQKRGYYSKIINRNIVAAATCTVWQQEIPVGGYIVPHCHPFEEVLTLLAGVLTVTVGDQTYTLTATTSLLIAADTIHSANNQSDAPVHLLAFLATATPEIVYPSGLPQPVKW